MCGVHPEGLSLFFFCGGNKVFRTTAGRYRGFINLGNGTFWVLRICLNGDSQLDMELVVKCSFVSLMDCFQKVFLCY